MRASRSAISSAAISIPTRRHDQRRKASAITEGEERHTNDLINSGISDDEVIKDAPQRVAGLGRAVTDYIVEHPEICLVLALAIGAAVGVVVKRK